jgi:hypothetical protein
VREPPERPDGLSFLSFKALDERGQFGWDRDLQHLSVDPHQVARDIELRSGLHDGRFHAYLFSQRAVRFTVSKHSGLDEGRTISWASGTKQDTQFA